MNILFALAEAYPFVKAGGLGDVGGSLPAALNRAGADVRVILPKYKSIPADLLKDSRVIATVTTHLSWRTITFKVEMVLQGGVTYYLIDHPPYFHRDGLYGYVDDGERFAFYSKAVLDTLPHLDFRPEILHCHDWHAALIPLYLKESYGESPHHQGMRSILTIHNLRHQGYLKGYAFGDLLGFGNQQRSAYSKLSMDGELNVLKGGLLSADLITTVSPTYGEEIKTPYYGERLDGILRYRDADLYGILNGIDTEAFNPQTDPALPVPYRTSLEKKAQNKIAFQEAFGLPLRKEVLMVSIISRLVDQKGLDLVAGIMEELLTLDLQLVVLGTGDPRYEGMFRYHQERHPDKVRALIQFDESLAHRLYAATDLLLMPSQFEPCGLSQMISMRYGTLPLVRETGGLKDSVHPYNRYTGEGNGFGFLNYNAHELLFTLKDALALHRENPSTWKALVRQAQKTDFSWKISAERYLELYGKLI